jgi:hypothetical protein
MSADPTALTRVPTGAILKSLQFDPLKDSIMTFPAHQRTDRVAALAYTRHGAVPVTRRPSQRELVAWSLLRCPDDRPPQDRR